MARPNPLQFIQQVRSEAAKVVWPTRRETVAWSTPSARAASVSRPVRATCRKKRMSSQFMRPLCRNAHPKWRFSHCPA